MADDFVQIIGMTINLPRVDLIVLTDDVPDGTGGYVREIRFFQVSDTGAADRLLVTVRANSDNADSLKITTAPQQI